MNKTIIFIYAVACYAIGMASFVLLGGFLINLPASIGIDRAAEVGET